MKYYLTALISTVLIFFVSCENRYRKNVAVPANAANSNFSKKASATKQNVDLAKDAYQVSTDEYDEFFTTRYGLLYQKFSDTPFSGRIVTVENGPEGKFVIADEGWRNGKKDGTSTRWFSNGVKMYERNYTDGKWNGTVTRWWPNGQKMYVRAYSDGVRHGEEATWRSDGTPIKTASNITDSSTTDNENEGAPVNEDSSISTDAPDNVTEVPESIPSSIEEPVLEPELDAQPVSTEPSLPQITDSPALPEIAPVVESVSEETDLPDLALPSESDVAEEVSSEPEMDLPVLPDVSAQPSDSTDLPVLPGLPGLSEPESPSELPGLPGIPTEPENTGDLPALPELSEGNDLPPMPVEDDGLPGLPPLPSVEANADSGSDDLPPLPPLP